MTSRAYLELSFRKGKPLAGYLYLPRQEGDLVFRSEPMGEDLVVDFTEDGRAIGMEILCPQTASISRIRDLLASVNAPAVDAADLRPLCAS